MEDDEDHEGPNRYDDAVFGLDGIIIAKFMKSWQLRYLKSWVLQAQPADMLQAQPGRASEFILLNFQKLKVISAVYLKDLIQ